MISGDLDESLESPERMMGQSSSAVAWCIAWCMCWTWVVCAYSWCAFGSGVQMVSVACLKAVVEGASELPFLFQDRCGRMDCGLAAL